MNLGEDDGDIYMEDVEDKKPQDGGKGQDEKKEVKKGKKGIDAE